MVVVYARPPPYRQVKKPLTDPEPCDSETYEQQPIILIHPWVLGTPEYHKTFLEPFKALGPLFDGTRVAQSQTEFAHAADAFFSAPGPSRHSGKGIQLNTFDFEHAAAVWADWVRFSSDPKFSATSVMFEDHHLARLGEKVGGDNAWRKRDKHMYMLLDVM